MVNGPHNNDVIQDLIRDTKNIINDNAEIDRKVKHALSNDIDYNFKPGTISANNSNQNKMPLDDENEGVVLKATQRRLPLQNSIDSGIIENSGEIDMVTNKLNKGNRNILLRLLYRASTDGDSAATFHRLCDDHENTIVFVKDKNGNRFGGYTTQTWNGESEEKMDPDAFIFSLNKRTCYDVIQGKPAVGGYSNFGPIFFGCQIRIYDKCLNYGGSTYKKGRNYYTNYDYELTNGNQNFEVVDVEVFQVTFQ